jgi:hypothetical protein
MGTLKVDSIQKADGTRGMAGITDGANAASGIIGEYLESRITSTIDVINQPVNNTWYASASWALSIPAGDWDLHLNASVKATGAMGGQGAAIGVSLSPTTSANTIVGGRIYSSTQMTTTAGKMLWGAHIYCRWNTSVAATLYPAVKYEAMGSAVTMSTLSWWAETTTEYNIFGARRMR